MPGTLKFLSSFEFFCNKMEFTILLSFKMIPKERKKKRSQKAMHKMKSIKRNNVCTMSICVSVHKLKLLVYTAYTTINILYEAKVAFLL